MITTSNPSPSPSPKQAISGISAKALPFLALILVLLAPVSAHAAFGLTTNTNFYKIDTGAGLVFEIRRTDNGSSTQSPGDIMSLVYNGVEYQDQTRGSQVNSGFDFLYTGTSAVTVSAAVNTNFIVVTVVAGALTHYYMARSGFPNIYMATYFTVEPNTESLCRYIVRIPNASLPNGPVPSNILNTDVTVESSDIFAYSATNANIALRGQTRAKHYSNMRLKDWSYIGATGANVGIWVVRDNNEGNSGGPFFRCLLNQGAADQEITYIVNYGEGQTEAYRTGILNSYTLVCTNGAPPGAVDTSWFANMNLTGYVAPSGRGSVTCPGITGRDTSYKYTAEFSNANAQYWTDAASSNGSFTMAGMIPGTYTMSIYKNELAVYTSANATVTASGTTALGAIAITADPSSTAPLWRIGNWDGTPAEFLNGTLIDTMHPSDVRMATWNPGPYTIGVSSPGTGMPCYQWKDVNANQVVQFNLAAAQLAASTIRVGITTAYAGGRPNISVNSYTATLQGAPTEPSTRTMTIGSYRGNNVTYTFSVPASALVAGTNTLTIYPISGSSGTTYLSPGYSTDAVDMYQGAATTLAIPNPPTALTTVPRDTQVGLSWPTSAGATSYTVQRASTSGGPYSPIASALSGTNCDDTGLIDGTTYYYVVNASNGSGTGINSPEAAVTPQFIIAPPTGLSGTPGNTQVSLSWTAPSGATGFNVKRATTNGGPYTTIYTGTATSCVDTGLVNGATYYYVVSALKNGGESLNSIQAAISPVGPPQIAYLRFDETSGVSASDSTGNGWNGTLINGSTWAAGKINNAVSLDGSNDYVMLPAGVVSGLNDFTISAWVYLNSVTNWARVFDFGTGNTTYMFLTAENGATSKVRFAITTNGGAGEQQIDGTAALPAGTWTHVAITLSGSVGTLYLNGAPVGTNSSMTLKPSSLGSTSLNYIGKSQYADPYLSGLVDEFQIYNRALSSPEVATLAGSVSAPTGLAAVAGNGKVSLNWNGVSGATGYNLRRATSSGGPYTIIATALTGTSYTNGSLSNGTSYYYVVTAVNGLAESSNSTMASARPTAPVTDIERLSISLILTGTSSNAVMGSSIVGHTYQLEYCDDLGLANWQPYGSPISGNGGTIQLPVPINMTATRRFYKVIIQP